MAAMKVAPKVHLRAAYWVVRTVEPLGRRKVARMAARRAEKTARCLVAP